MKEIIKNKKQWYGRWWAIVLYIFVGIIILSAIFGTNNSNQEANTTGGSSIPKEQVKTTFGLNERVVSGDFAYTLHKVETKSQVSNVLGTKKADGVYLILDLTIENVGKTPEYLFDYVVIVDEQGRIFEEDIDAKMYYGYDKLFSSIDKLNPGIPKRGEMIFQVPTDISGKVGLKKSQWTDNIDKYISW